MGTIFRGLCRGVCGSSQGLYCGPGLPTDQGRCFLEPGRYKYRGDESGRPIGVAVLSLLGCRPADETHGGLDDLEVILGGQEDLGAADSRRNGDLFVYSHRLIGADGLAFLVRKRPKKGTQLFFGTW